MYELCQEDDSLGTFSKMPPASKQRSQEIRGELWDLFASLCQHHRLDPTPESLSSAAGCLPSTFSDMEPDMESFKELILNELSMM